MHGLMQQLHSNYVYTNLKLHHCIDHDVLTRIDSTGKPEIDVNSTLSCCQLPYSTSAHLYLSRWADVLRDCAHKKGREAAFPDLCTLPFQNDVNNAACV